MRILNIFIILFLVFNLELTINAKINKWIWYSSFIINNEWRMYKGEAKINISKDKFIAKLYLKPFLVQPI